MTILPDPQAIERIAVRLTNWVGDCVMNTPFLARVKALFPKAHVTVYGRRHVVPLFEGHPDVHRAVAIDDHSFRAFKASAGVVREGRHDLGFALPNSIKSAALLAFGGVQNRVGFNRDARRMLLTHPVTLRPEDLAVHEVRYYLRLLAAWERESVQPPPLRLVVTDAERTAMERWLAERGIGPGTFVVAVNPAALYGSAKRWYPDRYARVAAALRDEHGPDSAVVVTGLPQERDVAAVVCEHGGARFLNAAGEMKLRELMAFLSRANLLLTNDSGAMHLAAALGTRTVAVFGSTDWVTTAPLGTHCRIVRVPTPCAPCLLRDCPIDHRCMTRVTVEAVLEAARG